MTRPELLADLADAINELTRPRQHREMIETSSVEETTTRRGKRRKASTRIRVRRAHNTTMPPLLRQLEQAAVPGAGTITGSPAGFESSPAAELEPLSVLRDIGDRAGYWVRTFNLDDRHGLPATLQALVSAPHDEMQLELITRQARRWVRDARVAVGLDPPPITISAACPYCHHRHCITIGGDLQSGRCGHCAVFWTVDTIGLLAEMIRANENNEVLALEACWMGGCVRYGDHDEHRDSRGRTWGDSCPIDLPMAQ